MASVDDGSVELSVRVRKVAGVFVIDARGEIDVSNAAELQPAIESALQAEGPVVVDLCAVSFLDSTGLYALLVLRRRMIEQGRRVAIACWPSTLGWRLSPEL